MNIRKIEEKVKHIGIALPATPNYSETFINSKIKGLLQSGFIVSLYVEGKRKSNAKLLPIPIYYQVDKNSIFHLIYKLITS